MANAFNLGVLGMTAQNEKMAVIGNNIANSQTTAYKANSASFSELFITHSGQSVNGTHVQYGNGVALSGVTSDWSSGSLEETSSEADLAIEGEGFFAVQYPDQDEILYTRAGDFALVQAPEQINGGEGYVLMRPNGVVLCGCYDDDVDSSTGVLTESQKPLVFSAQVYEGGEWVDWSDSSMSSETMPSPTSFSISTDGVVTGTPETAEEPAEGDIRVSFTIDGSTTTPTDETEARIGIQRFNNPDSLEHLEGGMYATTDKTYPLNESSSGEPRASAPNLNGCGQTQQGMLEQSNVDLVTEFTNMIITQRAYQANSKTITTADEMLQTVMGLKN